MSATQPEPPDYTPVTGYSVARLLHDGWAVIQHGGGYFDEVDGAPQVFWRIVATTEEQHQAWKVCRALRATL